jgi:hypothetical protein
VLALGAFLSIEQAIFALPVAALAVSPARSRVKAGLFTGSVAAVVLASFAIWSGSDIRTNIGITDRVLGIFQDPAWYVKFPAAGLGLHSIPLAVWWALPYSAAILAIGGWLGARFGRAMPADAIAPHGDRHDALGVVAVAALLAVLINLPTMATVPRGVSGRIFAPTWLLLAAALALIADRIRTPRARSFWIGVGLFVTGAVLSLALSVDVRLATADFTRASSEYIAARLTSSNETVAVCGIERSVVLPAPVGSFAMNELIYNWSARYALKYETGDSATFVLRGPVWGTSCNDLPSDVDLVLRFDQLRSAAGLGP